MTPATATMKELGQGPHDFIATTGEDINSCDLDTALAGSRDTIEK